MLEYLDLLKYILSSDTIAFIVVIACAWMYLMKYKPAMERKEKLEKELEVKILAIPTIEEITKVITDNRDELAELAILDSHRKEIIKQIEFHVVELKKALTQQVGEQDTQHRTFGEGINKILNFISIAKDYIIKSENRLDAIEKRLEKVMISLRMTYALLDSFVSKMEESGNVGKVDRKSIDDFRENIQITQDELTDLMTVIGKFMKQSKQTSRMDRFLNEE